MASEVVETIEKLTEGLEPLKMMFNFDQQNCQSNF